MHFVVVGTHGIHSDTDGLQGLYSYCGNGRMINRKFETPGNFNACCHSRAVLPAKKTVSKATSRRPRSIKKSGSVVGTAG